MAYNIIVAFAMTLFYSITNYCMAGGPWAQGKEHGFAQVGFSSTIYKNIFDKNGEKQNALAKFQDLTFQFYSELGVSKKVTLKIIVPYKFLSASNGSNQQRLVDFGNMSAGASFLLIDKKFKAAVRIEISSPGIDDKNIPSYYNLKTGYTDWEISPIISIGSSSEKFYWYSDIGAGFTTNSVFKLNAEAGYSVLPSLKAAAVVDARIPFQRGNTAPEQSPEIISTSFLYDPFQQYIGIGGKLIYTYKEKCGISGSAFGALLAKRIAEAPAFNVGIFYKW